jgi:hypothetical protein
MAAADFASFGCLNSSVEIDPPVCQLKNQRCECCSGQGALCFYSCVGCGHIDLICDEVGTTFHDARNLEVAVYGGLEDPTCVCPNCRKVHIAEFRPSTSEEIQGMGFMPEEYA